MLCRKHYACETKLLEQLGQFCCQVANAGAVALLVVVPADDLNEVAVHNLGQQAVEDRAVGVVDNIRHTAERLSSCLRRLP